MSRSVPLSLPAHFVLENSVPTRVELAWGALNGYLTPSEAVAVAAAKIERGMPTTPSERSLAGLAASDAPEKIQQVLTAMQVGSDPVEVRKRVWFFLSVAWVHRHRVQFDDPLETVAMLWSDFDYPEEVADLVYYMPAGPDGPVGRDGLLARIGRYVETQRQTYRDRML